LRVQIAGVTQPPVAVVQIWNVRRNHAPEIYNTMKPDITFTEIRAGVISSLMLAIGYLYVTGFSSQFRVWAFMVLVAVCFVIMMKSLVDLFVCAFGLAAAFSGRGLGRAVRLIRSL
jgi:uncharacterized Tic20 family protein